MHVPVTKLAFCDARKHTTLATSSTLPNNVESEASSPSVPISVCRVFTTVNISLTLVTNNSAFSAK